MSPKEALRPRDASGRFTSKEVKTSKEFPKKTVAGIAAVALVGALAYANRDQIGNLFDNNDGGNKSASGLETTTTTSTLPETTTSTIGDTTSTSEAPIQTPTPEATPEAQDDLEQPYASSAEGENGVFQLMDSDNVVNEIDLSDVIGFTPDADLRVSDISPNELDPIPADAADFQAYLNTERDGFGPLAGFTDGTNDYNQYYNNESAPQLPAFSWMVHTGLFVEIPGIGRVEGGDSRAAVVIILNRTDDVYRWDTNSVKVIAGFQGWGRIWNGEADEVQETEERLVNHYRERLGKGVPETGFIGQCDEGAENCNYVTVVTVERVQWGENQDGTPRYQFRLIRAETIPTSSN